MRIALEDPRVNEARRCGGRVEHEADAQRHLELFLPGVRREHRVFEHRQAQRIDLRPHRLEAPVVNRQAADI